MPVISKQQAMHFRSELTNKKHGASGKALTESEVTHRMNALADRACTLKPAFKDKENRFINRMRAEFEKIATHTTAEADRVIAASNTHVTATGDRVAQEVVAALKEDKGPDWRDDMTGPEQKVFFQNRRAADLNQMRDLGLVSKPAQPTEKPQWPTCAFIEVR